MSLLAEPGTYVEASGTIGMLWLLLVVPFAGAAALLLAGKRLDKAGPMLGTLVAAASFVLSVVFVASLLGRGEEERALSVQLFSWIPVEGFQVDAGLLLDPLSAMFILLITGVGTLIHVYSLGYMEHDPRKRVFFAYLNLFLGAMLLLVLGNSFLALYVGWEGVGLASYLLISFYFYKPEAATAAKKAFIANRVGDVGLSLAIMLMFATLGTTSFAGVFSGIGGVGGGTITAIALLLLLGACGKSGQFPLQTWLPDAMEGPTPVSALIHAATMVTAGVYLIARSAPVFDLSPDAQTVVVVVGAITIMIGAIIGCVYDDIKKVLAYSTVSQIGYMFLAVGLGPVGYAFALLHLLTHGFFKACMFLGAGSVMHGMNEQVDMRRFGGLRTVMPITFGTFLCGYLAIIGFPGFAGFFSKDKIIEAALGDGGVQGWLLGGVTLLAAALTAFYMTRLMIMTFFGQRRWTDDVHPHESPLTMTVPMMVLAVGSVVSGYVLLHLVDLPHFLEPVLGPEPKVEHVFSELTLSIITTVFVAAGVLAAYLLVYRRPVPTTAPVAVTPFTVAARRNLYADAVNEAVLMRPGQYLTRALVFFDARGLDGAVNGIAAAVGGGSGRLRRLQNGFVRSYALAVFAGALLVLGALVVGQL